MSADFCVLFFRIEWESDDESSKGKFLEICFSSSLLKIEPFRDIDFIEIPRVIIAQFLNSSGDF